MLSDTVGFISDLPTTLVEAFRATLEEVIEADVILHVRDISHVDADAQQQDVENVLRQLDIDPEATDTIIDVWNKIDSFDAEGRERLANIAARGETGRQPLLVSAVTGEGVDALLEAIEQKTGCNPRRSIWWSMRPTARASAGCIEIRKCWTKTLRDDGRDGQ